LRWHMASEEDPHVANAMMERAGMAMPGMGMQGAGAMPTAAGTPAGMSMMMVPRCTLTFEKCAGGMKIQCVCDDRTSAAMLQNLCTMLAGGMCSCCAYLNGMMACGCNLVMGMCKCEPTDDGVCITCTSGDKACATMIQACCETMAKMGQAGCTCCVLMNNMPVCCSC
jgi:hypothetical protein